MKRLVLVGGGHAHLQVLAALAGAPLADTEVTLVSPHARPIYSGMLPGWLAGDYPLEDCTLALDRLARRADVRFMQTACHGLDLAAGTVLCGDGRAIPFDHLSIATGAVAGKLAGSAEHGLPLRPIAGFVAAWPDLLQKARQPRFRLAIVGDGAAATELAFAIQARFAVEGLRHTGITLIGSQREVLAGFPSRVRRKAAQLLAARGIAHLARRRVVALLADQVQLDDGSRLAADATVIAGGGAAPRWPADSGLATDAAGFIRINALLQSVSHPRVFAAGDLAAHAEARPKSGVFAVRAGPPLAHNLRAICQGQALQAWHPQRRALYLIGTGQRQALAAWGGFSACGAWAWRWKDRIDRRFVAQFAG